MDGQSKPKKTHRRWTTQTIKEAIRTHGMEGRFGPTAKQLRSIAELPDPGVIIHHFGSVPACYEEMGIQQRRKRYTDEELDQLLADAVKDRKTYPGKSESKELAKERFPSYSTLSRRRNGVRTVVKALGVRTLNPRRTDQEMLDELAQLYKTLKRKPTVSDIDLAASQGACGTTKTYERRFGSLFKARQLAGMEPIHTRDRVLTTLHLLTYELGHVPRLSELNTRLDPLRSPKSTRVFQCFDIDYPGVLTIAGHVGRSGKPVSEECRQTYGLHGMTRRVNELAVELDRVPTPKDIQNDCKAGNSLSYEAVLKICNGSLGTLLELSGFPLIPGPLERPRQRHLIETPGITVVPANKHRVESVRAL